MSFLRALGNLTQAAIQTAALPLSVAKDAMNSAVGDDANATARNARKIKQELDDAYDELDR